MRHFWIGTINRNVQEIADRQRIVTDNTGNNKRLMRFETFHGKKSVSKYKNPSLIPIPEYPVSAF